MPSTSTGSSGLARSAALLAVLVVMWTVVALRSAEPGPAIVPPAVLGTWESDDPRYAGRLLQITPSAIVWDQGDDTELAAKILACETVGTESYDQVHFTYGESFEESRTTAFIFDGMDSLFPVNRREVEWKRVDPDERRDA